MFSRNDTLADDYRDDVGAIVALIQKIDTMTGAKRELIADLKAVAKKHGYLSFSAGNHRWHIGKVGESYLYKVPTNKLGLLKPFRGKLVRVVCVGSGTRWIRSYLVGEV